MLEEAEVRVIGGEAKGRRLFSPKGQGTRPTAVRVREALFNILAGSIAGASFLDLFAGTGAVGIEALSRGAAHATFVEKDRSTARLLRQNLQRCGFVGCSTVLVQDAHVGLASLGRRRGKFTIIFADPPYRQVSLPQVVGWVGQTGVLAEGGVLVVEHRSGWAPDMESEGPKLQFKRSKRYGDTALYFFAGTAQ